MAQIQNVFIDVCVCVCVCVIEDVTEENLNRPLVNMQVFAALHTC